ncbi:hypothetical protein RMQ97_14845 [Maricaulis sp. D1M11]|uniref:hypothetical protein n=1 Tax=Maricaulis sp. D1M11 TaxID=3076117 RepID=UPI0039B49BD6
MKSIVLHIGFPKTGTTSIQAGLAGSRLSLAESGFFYPQVIGERNHFALEAYAAKYGDKHSTHTVLGIFSDEDLNAFKEDIRERLLAEVSEDGKNCNTVLLSNEGLAGLSSDAEFSRLKELLDPIGDITKVICYIRRQDLNAVSNYTTYLKTGGTRQRILLDYPKDSNAYIFYGKKLKLWSKWVGIENVDVRIFDPLHLTGGDIFVDFKFAAGLPDEIDISVDTRTNPSLTPAACEFLRRFNERFPRFVDGKNNPLRSGVREMLEERYPGSGIVPSRAEAEHFMRQFASSNEYIRANWFPRRESLFDDDFSKYPVEPDFPDIDSVAEVFLELWEYKFAQKS